MQNIAIQEVQQELTYLKLLSKHFPTINDASTEIINLGAILKLPKGTEHFLSDVHGENEAFSHVLKNASGAILRKIESIFGTSLMASEKRALATLIYYPDQKLDIIEEEIKEIDEWYRITLYRLIDICRSVSLGYTRSKVRKALPPEFSYILEELLQEKSNDKKKEAYFSEIINNIIELDKARDFIIALSKLIQMLVIDKLHIIGDIYDRGPGAEKIMDILVNYHSCDVQWGNHDIVWMGAASGSEACIANALRVTLRYGNMHTIEEGYGINLYPLISFASEFYKDDPCKLFMPKLNSGQEFTKRYINLLAKMQKAITIIQWKLEGQLIKNYPEFHMENRLLLDKINIEKGIINIEGQEYKMLDSVFPTLDISNPYKLTNEENEVIEKIKRSFMNNEKLQSHTRFLFSNGSMYLAYNSILMYHGCIPMNENGDFTSMTLKEKKYKGKELLDILERYARDGFFIQEEDESKKYGRAIMWYLWLGPASPIFGKNKMATFENYFLEDKELQKEVKTAYYNFRDQEGYADKILCEFNLDPNNSCIVNGHVPVKTKKGESPIKANGKLIVIDGGFSKAYQETTGIAGYTLVSNEKGLAIVAHEPFESTQKAIQEESDIISSKLLFKNKENRLKIEDTDIGKDIKMRIKYLKHLLVAYRKGMIKEKK